MTDEQNQPKVGLSVTAVGLPPERDTPAAWIAPDKASWLAPPQRSGTPSDVRQQPIEYSASGFVRGVLPPQGLHTFLHELSTTFQDVIEMYSNLVRFQAQSVERAIDETRLRRSTGEHQKHDENDSPSSPSK